jgi:AmmeMemoRadiSam system protein A/AmmeMemoRadiSam system protein B
MFKGFLVPHPPLLIKGVGDGSEIPATRAAYEEIGRQAQEYGPEVTVIISPHSVLYADYFHISPGAGAKGDFRQFRCPQVKFDVEYDEELAQAIAGLARESGIPAGFLGERDKALDHGVMVPLYFLRAKRIVRVSLSGLGYGEQYRFGMCIGKAIEQLGRRAVVAASGDMSHKLGGSYGFSPFGVEHDKYVRESIERADIRRLFAIPPEVAENAAECGLRAIMIMCGAFDGWQVKPKVLSYEAPYGVGYLCASFAAAGQTGSLLPQLIADKNAKLQALRQAEDPFVKLARANVEHFTRTGKAIKLTGDMSGNMSGNMSGDPAPDPPLKLPPEMLANKAGVFVSIKKNGSLRGCIGTTAPTAHNIALEIIQNGVAACSQDTRFQPVTPEELEELTYNVDVLSPPEPIADKSQLDVKKYGVIVTSGYKRGLLLPDLEGVDSVDEQIAIAMQKGGIKPTDKWSLERFEVTRHK